VQTVRVQYAYEPGLCTYEDGPTGDP